MPKKRYVVTGGSGFIGRALVHALVKSGNHVRVFDNLSRSTLASISDLDSKIEFVCGDVRDPAQVSDACSGMDAVCHLASVNGTEFFYSKPELVLEVGVKGIVNVIDACQKHNIRDLLVMSSSEVYQNPPRIPADETVPLSIPDPLNPRYSYAGQKIISELMAINFGRKHLDRLRIVRPHNVYGPQMGWEHVIPQFITRVQEALNNRTGSGPLPLMIQGTGEEARAFVHIDDFTRGVMAVLEKGEHLGIYHVGTTEEFSIRDVLLEVARAFDVAVKIESGPLTPGSVMRRCPSIQKVSKLGYVPQVSFRDGVKQTVDWYRKALSEGAR